jgi:hypothetical protein
MRLLQTMVIVTIAASAVPVLGQGATSTKAGETTVPMQDYGHRPVLEATINGKGPYRLVFDTGATGTVISPEWVDGKTGPIQLDTLGIGSLSWKKLPVRSASIFGGGTVPDDFPKGVLSAAAFPGYLVTFDYPNHTITIRRGALPAADGKRVFQYGANEALPVAPIRVGGKELSLHIDTGSPGGLMLPMHYAQELPLSAEPVAAGKARTVAGEFDVVMAPVKGAIALGEYTLDVPMVRFSDLRPGPGPAPGNFGYEILRTFKVTFDSANRRLLFER